jgi:hypothetical protein
VNRRRLATRRLKAEIIEDSLSRLARPPRASFPAGTCGPVSPGRKAPFRVRHLTRDGLLILHTREVAGSKPAAPIWKRPDSGAKLAGAPCPMVPNRRPPREPSGARCPSPQVHYSSEYDEPSDVDRAVAGHPVLGEVARRIADELLDVLTHELDRPFGVTSHRYTTPGMFATTPRNCSSLVRSSALMRFWPVMSMQDGCRQGRARPRPARAGHRCGSRPRSRRVRGGDGLRAHIRAIGPRAGI